jgi:lambda family phage portal protein
MALPSFPPLAPRAATVRVRVKGTGLYIEPLPTRLDASLSGTAAPAPHQAASTGRRMGGWRPTGAGPNAIVQASAPELLRRSRDLARNNPHARRALGLYGTHIVGIGIKPRSLCPDRGVRDRIHSLWDRWVDQADADGAWDLYGLQNIAVAETAEGGEVFARLRNRRVEDGLAVPLQIQLLPAEMVPLHYAVPNGLNAVDQGIERDALGRRVAYWVHRRHPGDAMAVRADDTGLPVRVPVADVLHVRNAPPNQLRGLPWLAAAITTLKQVADFQDAALLRKQMLTMLVGFVRRAVAGDMTAEELAKAWGEVRQDLGDLPAVTLEPGTMQYLEPGEEVHFTNWQDSSAGDEVFLRTSLQTVAAAADVIYEELTGDWSKTNDRTFRAALNTFKRRTRQHQHLLLGFQFNRPIYERFIDAALFAGALRVPAGMDDADLRRVEWIPERWEYLNPKQDIDAVVTEIDNGLTSRTAAVAGRGDDVERVDEQRAADRERDRRLGLTAPAAPQPVAVSPAGDAPQGGGRAGRFRTLVPTGLASMVDIGLEVPQRLPFGGDLANRYRDPRTGRFTFGPGGKKTKRFARRALADRSSNELLVLGGVTNADRVLKDARLNGGRYSLGRYLYTLSSGEVRKIHGKHGHPQGEAKRGQIAVTASDYKRLPAILQRPDKVMPGDKNHLVGTGVLKGTDDVPAIQYEKRLGSVRYQVIVRVQRKQFRLAVLSMWKRPA